MTAAKSEPSSGPTAGDVAFGIIAESIIHTPIHRHRIASAYTTDEGQEIPEHTLHAFDCSCGYRASVYMASVERARAIFDRNLPHGRRGTPKQGADPTLDELADQFLASAEKAAEDRQPDPDPQCWRCGGSGVIGRDKFGNWDRCPECEQRDEEAAR